MILPAISAVLGLVVTATAAPLSDLTPRQAPAGAPSVALKNGSYYGVHSTQYNQDFFLGMPFAQPPIGDLRYRNPRSLNRTWAGTWPATDYAFECVGYGGDQIGYLQDEDCLYLNLVRPSGCEDQKLPVAVWIHGGGFYEGGTADKRYNLSFIVENSVQIGKPIIAISIPYRLGPFGFLYSDQIQKAGQTNIGLRDQRLALHWIQENIAAFGGDPSKVSIWGESAGAASVGFHLTAYNGRDDKLFRAAVSESGNPILYSSQNGTSFYTPRYNALLQATGCTKAPDSLACLRQIPFTVLNNVLNTTQFNSQWNPVIDGDFLVRYGSQQLADGAFVKVPIISGANSDEGTAFGATGIYTQDDFIRQLNTTNGIQPALPQWFIQKLLAAYPQSPSFGIPSSQALGGDILLGAPYGPEYRREAAYAGDVTFIAPRRRTCETWAAAGLPAYCYRFNTIPAGIPWPIEVTHFQEVAFVFNNLQGLGYAINPFQNKSAAYTQLSKLMSNSWASFFHDLNPNNWTGRAGFGAEDWPTYAVNGPKDFVFDANRTSYAEPDTFRAEGIKLINDNAALYHR
ncbi:alpha/beta-hydrolase [Myriangium duriaei CBS 260.36]|uniref:Carboxylic ester hydrolase n=1 Tax=Myriangium duriaei CBS 260.36 TaxID=1168546 RepID=A0A9P4J1Y3_9PEZI|nr:alpha/beta-hydrolase [Myriangium duriaei CBS 260.36]